MKTVTPDMKLDKQVRKGLNVALLEINNIIGGLKQATENGDADFSEGILRLEKARYALNLVDQMVTSASNGQPRPWSEFSPMIDEEFD